MTTEMYLRDTKNFGISLSFIDKKFYCFAYKITKKRNFCKIFTTYIDFLPLYMTFCHITYACMKMCGYLCAVLELDIFTQHHKHNPCGSKHPIWRRY